MSHGHHHKFYERSDGYKYTVEELDAYRIPAHHRDVCVNLFVPFHQCMIKNYNSHGFSGLLRTALTRDQNQCHQEQDDFNHCRSQLSDKQHASQVKNAYYVNPSYAKSQGVSATLEETQRRGVIMY